MLKKLRSRWIILVLLLLLVPAVAFAADYWYRGSPCHAERAIYYSDATYTTVVGGDEFICYEGRHVWGQKTFYSIYEYIGPCCDACIRGSCSGGVEP